MPFSVVYALILISTVLYLSMLYFMRQTPKPAAVIFLKDNWVLRCGGELLGSCEKSRLMLICIPSTLQHFENLVHSKLY